MAKGKSGRLWYLVAGGIVLLGGVVLVVALPPGVPPLRRAIQAAALTGYTCVFLSILSSAYLRELVRFFGRPFTQLHHVVSVLGLAVLIAHPTLAAIESGTVAVFVPAFSPFRRFLSLGGRLAWYLLAVGSLAGLLRKSLGRNWRVIHYLNYLTLLLATPHALLIGTSFQGNVVLQVLIVLMALAAIAVFIRKRVAARARVARRT
jgi:DMSO/TMAO reductase YedYZ heme-binding membrane subunit